MPEVMSQIAAVSKTVTRDVWAARVSHPSEADAHTKEQDTGQPRHDGEGAPSLM